MFVNTHFQKSVYFCPIFVISNNKIRVLPYPVFIDFYAAKNYN